MVSLERLKLICLTDSKPNKIIWKPHTDCFNVWLVCQAVKQNDLNTKRQKNLKTQRFTSRNAKKIKVLKGMQNVANKGNKLVTFYAP